MRFSEFLRRPKVSLNRDCNVRTQLKKYPVKAHQIHVNFKKLFNYDFTQFLLESISFESFHLTDFISRYEIFIADIFFMGSRRSKDEHTPSYTVL